MLSSNPIVTELLSETLSAIAQGKRLVVWGVQANGLEFLGLLSALGFISSVAALVDHESKAQDQEFMGMKVLSPDKIEEIEFDTVIITSDREKEVALESLSKHCTRLHTLIFAGNGHYDFADSVFDGLVKSCPVKSKAGGYSNMLVHLYQCLKYISLKPVKGDVAEFGVYQGGTTVFMAKVLKYFGNDCQVFGFDTFSGFPERSHLLDTYNDKKCEFPDPETVKSYCAPHNIRLIQGDIRTTCHALADKQLALTFFDTDNYSATKKALEMCIERTVPGGVLAFDHYFSPSWVSTIGERIAAKQVLSKMNLFHLHGTGIFLKV
jgi:hypothetical protein